MHVPARIYASDKLLQNIFKDKSLAQLINLTTLQGIVDYGIVMPDVHEGYGAPIGGIFATDPSQNGIISPGAVGYDINCGVRLLISNFTFKDIKDYLDDFANQLQIMIPSGLGKGGGQKLTPEELDGFLQSGAKEAVSQGYGESGDLENCEAGGRLEWANPKKVSSLAKKRGSDQLGTLGSGNHFLEVQKVEKIFNKKAAKAFGLFENQVVVMIHTGSRGLGHQIATDYIRIMIDVMPKYKIYLPDRELACVPFESKEGQDYFVAMACGANFAWANRQMITHHVRTAWAEIFDLNKLDLLYDVAHNVAKLEDYSLQTTDNSKKNNAIDRSRLSVTKLIVHRKGATRAFPPNHPELPKKYRPTGQPVIIPGSMGTASYILHGVETGKESFYSAAHGAGRVMSRHQAVKSLRGKDIIKNMEERGIIVKTYSMRGVAEEAPQAYKNVDEVVETIHQSGLAKKVARLVPLAVIKGE